MSARWMPLMILSLSGTNDSVPIDDFFTTSVYCYEIAGVTATFVF